MKILIYIELKDKAPVGGSLELISAVRSLGAESEALIIGRDTGDAARITAECGASRVMTVDLEEPLTEEVICSVIKEVFIKGDYSAVFASATTLGKTIIPVIASGIGGGAVTDITDIEYSDGSFLFTRPAYGGTIFEKRRVISGPAAASIRGGSFPKPEPEAQAVCPEELSLDIAGKDFKTRIAEIIEEASEEVNLEEARIIVSGGRGMGSEENFKLIYELAEAFGGVVGASRPVIENGWISRQHQVGQSGKIVSPDLYVAVGISGAVQHLSGMSGSKYIIAINKDEDAPIFGVADAGIVGDALKILPLFIEAVKKYEAER